MHRRPGLTRTRWTVLLRLLAVLAMVAQGAVALAAIGEGRDGIGLASHVEATGASATHYAHDEATCAACQARSLHGGTPQLPSAGAELGTAHQAASGIPGAPPASPALPTNPARAPPSVI